MKHLPPDMIQAKIRNALVCVVADKGVGATSVAAVAKKAGVSTGTIYLHFENKDDLLQKVYLHIKTEFHGIMMQAADAPDSKAMIRKMWFDLFAYVHDHPMDFMFIEFAGAAQVLTGAQMESIALLQADIAALLQRTIDDGTVVDLPVPLVITLLIAPAMYLARTGILEQSPLTPDVLNITFERVWRSVAASI